VKSSRVKMKESSFVKVHIKHGGVETVYQLY